MTFNLANRVKETSTTIGTGTFDLDGASTGFQTFVDGVGTTNACHYTIEDGTDWEVGLGTVTSGSPDTLSRTTVLASSNADAKVNWGSGTRDVYLVAPAELVTSILTTNFGTSRPAFLEAKGMWLDTTANPWLLKLYDGADDIVLGEFDSTANVFTPWTNGEARGGKSALINGNFDLWERGTGWANQASVTYTADRWNFSDSGGIATISRKTFTIGQTDVPGEPTYYLQMDVTTGNAGIRMEQRIEDVRTFAGETITISFWAKSDTPISPFQVSAVQNFGSGGSATIDNIKTVADTTTSWQKFTSTHTLASVSGKTIGAGSNLEIRFINGTTGTQALDIARVQVEPGHVATAFGQRPIGQELLLARRYFQTFSIYIPTAGEERSVLIGMRDTPTVTGGGGGFSSTGTTAETLMFEQTTGATSTLSLDAEI